MGNPSLNSFVQAPILGMLDLRGSHSTMSAFLSLSSAGSRVPGQAVKWVAQTPSTTFGNNLPEVIEIAAITDTVVGILIYNIKNATYAAGLNVEMALSGSIIYMNAGAAITTGANVELVVATPGNVITQTASNSIIGTAIDGASAANQLIRVQLALPSVT